MKTVKNGNNFIKFTGRRTSIKSNKTVRTWNENEKLFFRPQLFLCFLLRKQFSSFQPSTFYSSLIFFIFFVLKIIFSLDFFWNYFLHTFNAYTPTYLFFNNFTQLIQLIREISVEIQVKYVVEKMRWVVFFTQTFSINWLIFLCIARRH